MADLDAELSPFVYREVSAIRRHDRSPGQVFDRLAFAARALDVLRPVATRVVLFPSRTLSVELGRDLRHGPDAHWAMVGIPKDASAEAIALTLTELAGAQAVPFALQSLLGVARSIEQGS